MNELIYDGYAVYQGMTDQAKKRTSPDNVADVLDSMYKLNKAARQQAVPSGYAMVPVTASREIEDAIGRARNLKASEIWEDALAAAPQAEHVLSAAPAPAERVEQEIDQAIAIPLGLIAAACSAIDKKRDAPKLLAELRRYTVGDLSGYTAPQPTPSLGTELDQPQYTAHDMADQAAQGFRDGRDSVAGLVEALEQIAAFEPKDERPLAGNQDWNRAGEYAAGIARAALQAHQNREVEP